jgi:hypothetical protein
MLWKHELLLRNRLSLSTMQFPRLLNDSFYSHSFPYFITKTPVSNSASLGVSVAWHGMAIYLFVSDLLSVADSNTGYTEASRRAAGDM